MIISLQVHNFENQIFELAKPTPKAFPATRGRIVKLASPKKAKQAPSRRISLRKRNKSRSHLFLFLGSRTLYMFRCMNTL
jgi:hypothetical protein